MSVVLNLLFCYDCFKEPSRAHFLDVVLGCDATVRLAAYLPLEIDVRWHAVSEGGISGSCQSRGVSTLSEREV